MRTGVLTVGDDFATMAVGVLMESVQDMRPYP
jgi:hypothetical protein